MVDNLEEIVSRLKKAGNRITPARSQIIEIFINSPFPIAASDLIESFKILKNNINKTTIYRELEFLLKNEIIEEVEFGEGKKRYEIKSGHHHHLICRNCKRIEDIELKTDLSSEEKDIKKTTGFIVNNHSLEFFGICKNCS